MASCDYGDESSGSIKGGKFLEQVSDCWLLRSSLAKLKVTVIVCPWYVNVMLEVYPATPGRNFITAAFHH
jgi:hypothetical protein